MADRPRIIGIDLGTTNTLVASVKNRIPKIVPTDRGNLILPSVVALSAKGDLMVGGVAKDQMVTNPRNTLYGTKRLIGRKYNSRVVEELKGYFKYDIVEAPDGDAAVMLGGHIYTLPQVSSVILKQLKTIAEQFMGGPIEEAVISVPAYYTDSQRQAVKEAGKLAGFDVKRIVNEPTAAALAYGFNRGLDQKILVYDLGGGTFDVSVLHLTGNVFEVLATGGDTFLGGVDFDNRVIDYVLEKFWEETKVDLSQSPIAMQRIKNAAEAAKIDLTLIPNVVIDLPFIEERKGKPMDLRIPLTRENLNALTMDLVDRTFEICDRVLEEKGISRSEIDEIILVGGQSRMPLVQQRIQEHFGKPPRKGVHPDECVALGAALLADSLGSIDAVTLLDAVSMPIGYALPNGRVRRVIEKNSRIPLVKSFRLPAPEGAGRALHRDGHLPGRQRPAWWTTSTWARSGCRPSRRGGRSTSGSTRSACCRSSSRRPAAPSASSWPPGTRRSCSRRSWRAWPRSGPRRPSRRLPRRPPTRRAVGCSPASRASSAGGSESGMATFPSKEWCEQAVRLLNEDPERSLAAQGWQGEIGVIVDAEPGKLTRAFVAYVVPNNSRIETLRVLDDPDDLDEFEPAYLARAPYSVWKQLLQGSLDPVEAVLRRRIAVKGDLQQLVERLRFKGIADRLFTQLQTEYMDEQ